MEVSPPGLSLIRARKIAAFCACASREHCHPGSRRSTAEITLRCARHPSQPRSCSPRPRAGTEHGPLVYTTRRRGDLVYSRIQLPIIVGRGGHGFDGDSVGREALREALRRRKGAAWLLRCARSLAPTKQSPLPRQLHPSDRVPRVPLRRVRGQRPQRQAVLLQDGRCRFLRDPSQGLPREARDGLPWLELRGPHPRARRIL
ncbi:hypothetical protein S1OALGB6SA_645 [Olavius algarvensis spirochete endosymbiont]|nr:hypothetical protein S1OALGB6SA_645 [Olavius algarvensis spirochete endosymbiont]